MLRGFCLLVFGFVLFGILLVLFGIFGVLGFFRENNGSGLKSEMKSKFYCTTIHLVLPETSSCNGCFKVTPFF